MKSLRLYVSLTVLSVLLLTGFVLLMPDAEKEESSVLWKKQFKEIHIVNKEKPEDKIILERRGLFYQSYFIKHLNEFRLGGGPVVNIFRDWSEPVIKGILQDYSFEEDPSGIRLELYEAPKSLPVTVRFGPKTGTSDRIIEIDDAKNKKAIFIIQDHLFTRLFTDPMKMREKRVLIFPSDTYIESARITYPKPLEKGKTLQVLSIEAFHRKETPDGPELLRFRKSDGTEIERALSDDLERYIKQISIHKFRDESGISKEQLLRIFSEPGEDILKLEISIKRPGENALLRFREIPDSIAFDDKDRYYVLYNVSAGEADFILKNNVESLIRQSEMIFSAKSADGEKSEKN